jgi:hypothetical protein
LQAYEATCLTAGGADQALREGAGLRTSDELAKLVIAHFDGVFEGPNGDYPAVLQSLAGVTAAEAEDEGN